MNWKLSLAAGCNSLLLFSMVPASAQITPAQAPVSAPVSYASVSQLNGLLGQLEQTSQTTQGDLTNLRIEKWKVDANTKHQSEANAESIQRNLKDALPAMITELRSAPESLPSTFKLYRNLDALYDVFGTVVESAGAFGSKDEFQTLENDLAAVERSRRAFADRMESLAGSKETELARLRTEVQTAQAAAAAAPPKKVIVDDNPPAPVKKTVRKKPVPKPATANATSSTPPATTTPKQ
jgi:hypothetical protein